MKEDNTPNFICDEMLKKLARWLRILGFDTTDPSVEDDNELVLLSNNEKRILLTRDKNLSEMNNARSIRIFSDNLDEQLAQMLDHYPLDTYSLQCTRCPSCNGELKMHNTRDGEDIHNGPTKIPSDVFTMHDRIYICRECGKAYWTGSHWAHILERLDRIGIIPLLPGEQ